MTQPCTCVADFNASLRDHNTHIVETIGIPRDGRPMFTRPTIRTEKIESRRRLGPAIAVPTFCPFCGLRYEPEPAVEPQVEAANLCGNSAEAVARNRPEDCVGDMTPARAIYFIDRFKREEKLLGPHEQWALDYARAALASLPTTDQAKLVDSELFDALHDHSWDLRCFEVPTGGGDADIGWRVIAHYMAEPCERTVAEVYHDDPRAAVREALAAFQNSEVAR